MTQPTGLLTAARSEALFTSSLSADSQPSRAARDGWKWLEVESGGMSALRPDGRGCARVVAGAGVERGSGRELAGLQWRSQWHTRPTIVARGTQASPFTPLSLPGVVA